ncbi:polyphosphate kinase 2 [Devosia sp. 66-22]|uniref:polyphosphate kinase 2 n=1 Tax=Devosia sp. 66-22 TaxID=1895753 RepID=UPI000927BB08|nr:polyphosphate kinase 2 [Devosia sp. 66-22]OJX47610.1 MAG: polyphosphate kinase 2 [Devosia sp. 66-22]
MADDNEKFDLENPSLPKWVKKRALASGGYPYEGKLDDDTYATELNELYLELAKLQDDQARTGRRIVMVFEGRDAAGKGGTIDTYLENLNPRYSDSVALPKPSDRERTQWYFQRYVDWLPAAGEQVLFDRSWYNRAGVEPVMGFCTAEETTRFLAEVPQFERMLVNDGIHLFKFWLSIGREMQMKRFHDRRHDPLKRWKLSPVDFEALQKFDDYSEARTRMFKETHNEQAPWTVVLSNDKKRARLAVLRTVLRAIDYDGKDLDEIGTIDSRIAMDPDRFLADKHDR